MAYNESTAQRIRKTLQQKKVSYVEKKMFIGICFMVDDKLCCGTHIDKMSKEDLLFCRLSREDYQKVHERPDVLPMEMGVKKWPDIYWLLKLPMSFLDLLN